MPDESVRTVNVDLPAGLVGNPQNTPQCTHAQLTTGFGGGCPANTQVGVTVLKTGLGQDFVSAVYNLKPPQGVPAQFGFIALIPPVYINASVRNDGGLSVTIPNISQALPLTGTSLTFWGVPGDPGHDDERGPCLADPDPTVLCPFQGPVLPFLSNPTSCIGPGDHQAARHLVAERGGRESQLDDARGRHRLQRGALRSLRQRAVGQPEL